jgi:hypothetical protein
VSGPVTVYAMYQCGTFGHTPADAVRFAQQRLDLVGPRALEKAIWTGKDSSGASIRVAGEGPQTLFGAATPNGTTAVRLQKGIGLLAKWIGDNYGGVGVIHARRDVAAQLLPEPIRVGSTLDGVLGNRYAFGAG